MAAVGSRSAHHAWKVEYSSKRQGVGNPPGSVRSVNCDHSEKSRFGTEAAKLEHSLRGSVTSTVRMMKS